MIRASCVALMLMSPAYAQQNDPNNSDGNHGGFTLTPELDLTKPVEDSGLGIVEGVEQKKVATGPGAVLRGLDKVSGTLSDIEIANGQTLDYGRLQVQLGECRYPKGNPSGDAFGYLVIRPQDDDRPVFRGWMIASSPALNALDHPRYDVWLLRCKTS